MKMHLNLATRDLDQSVAFYRTLLSVEPTKHYADYALFLSDDPGLELALDLDTSANIIEGAHYGVVVEKAEDVDAAIQRLRGAGHAVDVETDETCCYAVQNKVWATDPDGRRWETYFVVAETEERDEVVTTCCATDEADAEAGAVSIRLRNGIYQVTVRKNGVPSYESLPRGSTAPKAKDRQVERKHERHTPTRG